jgi:hypothetical protein
MRVSFVRTVGATDRVYVVRDDGSEASWSFPTYGDELPHDLVHLVVESALGIRGVWAHVAAGADLVAINAKGAYEALGGEILRAEAAANAYWTRAELAPTAEDLVTQLAAAQITITAETAATIRERLLALRDRWRTLVPRGAIDLTYPA